MSKKLFFLPFAVIALSTPVAANACDLDGIDGLHRFNPFAKMAGIKGMMQLPPAPPVRSRDTRAETRTTEAKPALEETVVSQSAAGQSEKASPVAAASKDEVEEALN